MEMGERKMEGEDSVRTVDCLRGRLLAERAASRNAKEEAQLLENKLMELENLLRQEAKSRKRAEKKLKFLMKKLESITINTPAASSLESQQWKIKKQQEESIQNQETLEPKLEDASTSPPMNATFEDSLSEKSSSSMDQQSDLCCPSTRSSFGDEEGHDLNNTQIDDSMALVVVDTSQRSTSSPAIDPDVLDDTVREVLSTLKRAKEEIRASMERRRMMNVIRVGVGEVNLGVKTSTISI